MIKLKSVIVIILSSALISLVILFTILSLSLYLGWKEKESARSHNEGISRLNARLYSQFINIQELQANYEKEDARKRECLLEGTIKNNGYRTLTSVKVDVEFLNNSGEVIYIESLLPLKRTAPPRARTIAALSLFTSDRELPLLPGESARFKQTLSAQKDKDIASPIKYKRYATNPNEWSGKFNYKITNIKF